jgi:hypothetical protein
MEITEKDFKFEFMAEIKKVTFDSWTKNVDFICPNCNREYSFKFFTMEGEYVLYCRCEAKLIIPHDC